MQISSNTKVITRLDWLSGTRKTQIGGMIKPQFTTQDYMPMERGMLGYTTAWKYLDGVIAAVNLDRPDMGTLVQWSGDALAIEGGLLAQLDVMKFYVAGGWKLTRLDVAVDVYNHELSVERYLDAFKCGRASTRLEPSSWLHYRSANDGETLYLGGKTGKKRVRIYNKAAEDNYPGRWWRVEAQIRAPHAGQAAQHIIASEKPQNAITGIVRGIVDFPEIREWVMLMGMGEPLRTSESKLDGDTLEWLLKQVAPACGKLIANGRIDLYALFLKTVADEAAKWTDKRNW